MGSVEVISFRLDHDEPLDDTYGTNWQRALVLLRRTYKKNGVNRLVHQSRIIRIVLS